MGAGFDFSSTIFRLLCPALPFHGFPEEVVDPGLVPEGGEQLDEEETFLSAPVDRFAGAKAGEKIGLLRSKRRCG
jgi:hypothetical protein